MVASEVAAERSLGDLAIIAVASGVGELLQLVNDGLESTHKQALGLLDGLGSRSGGADLGVLRFQLPEPAFENVNVGEDLRVGIALATGLACATGGYATPSTPTYGRDRGRTHQENKFRAGWLPKSVPAMTLFHAYVTYGPQGITFASNPHRYD
jgi:hypothetical protein